MENDRIATDTQTDTSTAHRLMYIEVNNGLKFLRIMALKQVTFVLDVSS